MRMDVIMHVWGGCWYARMCVCLSVCMPFWSVLAHIFETSGWNNITFGSQCHIRIINSFSEFNLCDLDFFLGGGGSSRETI